MKRLAFVLFCISSTALGQQNGAVDKSDAFYAEVEAATTSNPQLHLDFHNLRQQRTALLKDSDDFYAVAPSVGGAFEQEVAAEFGTMATTNAVDIDNAMNFFALYLGMQSP